MRMGTAVPLITAVVGIVLLGATTVAGARVTGISLGPPFFPFGTTSFGSVGQYLALRGTVTGEVDPHDPLNSVVQDIDLAPRNINGMVSYTTTITIGMPIDPSTSNHTMLFDIVNRGMHNDYNLFAPAETDNIGDGFVQTQGFIQVFVGWQADLSPGPGFETISAPIAHQRDGTTITGVVRSEWTPSAPGTTKNILAGSSTDTAGYPTVNLDNSNDRMTMRVHQNDPKVLINNSDWAYADCTNVPFPGVRNSQKVCLKRGFDTNHIYELVYTARDPIVMGIGLAAIRDVASFLRDASADDFGNPNPLAGVVKYALLYGFSQSGQLLRTYLDLGFNEDEAHHRVFDGMQPERGARRNQINMRFSQPGRLGGGTEHTETQYPGGESPLTYGKSDDRIASIRGGLLDRCSRSSTCPKIVHTIGDNEYWESFGAEDTADALGRRDIEIPDNVRIYQFASTQHGGYSPLAPLPTSTGICQFLPNPNSYDYHLRALLMALQQWVIADTPPPPSRYSRVDRKTLVPLAEFVFPRISPLQNPQPLTIFHTRQVFYRGPEYDPGNISGIISIEPPIPLAEYVALVPQVDRDGNDIDGLRTVTLQVPLGTYTGWNIRAAGFSEGDACDLIGSYFPFAATKGQREMSGDLRPSLQERYGTLAHYNALATAVATDLVRQRLLLPSDKAAAVQSATSQAEEAGLK
jgi:hypothetical protein